jgi:hypothetical protein
VVILFAAHQGEELVLALPAIMLVAAFFILRWANQADPEESSNADEISPAEEDALVEKAAQSRR